MLLSVSGASDESSFTAGASKLVMTPAVESFKDSNRNGRWDTGEPFEDLNKNKKWDPVWLAGYQGGRFATGLHDNLWITALAVSDGKEPVLFITLDLIGYLFDEASFVKSRIKSELNISPSRVFIFSTHAHSGPDAIGLWGSDGKTGKDQKYLDLLRRQIVVCARDALKGMKPARAAFGKIRYPNPIEDSRPPKEINDLLLSMQVVDREGKTIATLVNYAMHAEVLNGKNTLITSDYPGVLREKLEEKLGGVGLFIPADIGGMQSPFVLFHSFWSRQKVGKALAEKVLKSLEDQKPRDIDSVQVNTKYLELPLENKRYLGGLQSGIFGRTKDFLIVKDKDKFFLPASISFIQIGPAQFLTLPGEAFPEIGNILRAKMAQEYPFILGLCDNEIGYIVPDDQWHDDGYEENMSLGRKTAEILIKTVSELFQKL